MACGTGRFVKLRGKRVTVSGAAPANLAIIDASGQAVGAMSAALEGQEARIQNVTIDADLRGFGLGGEAVRLFEKWAVQQGATRFRAAVAETNGLGVYFLLRLGYSPSTIGQAQGIFSMMRDAG